MKIIIQSDLFDIMVTGSPDYKGETCYLVRYGLQVETTEDLGEAMEKFKNNLDHALACEGY